MGKLEAPYPLLTKSARASGLASASAKPMGVLSGLDTIESDNLEARGITLTGGNCCHHAHDHQTKHLFAVLRRGVEGNGLHFAPGFGADPTHEVDQLLPKLQCVSSMVRTSLCQPFPLVDIPNRCSCDG